MALHVLQHKTTSGESPNKELQPGIFLTVYINALQILSSAFSVKQIGLNSIAITIYQLTTIFRLLYVPNRPLTTVPTALQLLGAYYHILLQLVQSAELLKLRVGGTLPIGTSNHAEMSVKFQSYTISRHRDFTRLGSRPSYRIVNRCPVAGELKRGMNIIIIISRTEVVRWRARPLEKFHEDACKNRRWNPRVGEASFHWWKHHLHIMHGSMAETDIYPETFGHWWPVYIHGL